MSRIETNKPGVSRGGRENTSGSAPRELAAQGRIAGRDGMDDLATGGQVEDQLEDFQALVGEVYDSCCRYFKQRPVAAVGALLAVGFYLGWKIRP